MSVPTRESIYSHTKHVGRELELTYYRNVTRVVESMVISCEMREGTIVRGKDIWEGKGEVIKEYSEMVSK